MAKKYSLETSHDGKTWKHRAGFEEGQDSRFGQPMSPEIMLKEGRSFIEYWSMKNRNYDREIINEISERKHVRVIIELS